MVYRSQGQNIHDKHFEVIIRKMMSKVVVATPGDTKILPGDYIDRLEIREINQKLLEEGKQPATFNDDLLGITRASLNTPSFLSAASFQHTIKVLAHAAISASEDPLLGLKENVILGKLIPAGTGYADHLDALARVEAAKDLDAGENGEDEPMAEIEAGAEADIAPESDLTAEVDAAAEPAGD